MIQLHLHAFYSSLLDDWRQDEAEDDLRDAVAQATRLTKFDTCSIEDVIEAAEWLASEEEATDAGGDEWQPDDLGELEQALLRRMFDHGNDLREGPEAAE
jgi:hypothetical protein